MDTSPEELKISEKNIGGLKYDWDMSIITFHPLFLTNWKETKGGNVKNNWRTLKVTVRYEYESCSRCK